MIIIYQNLLGQVRPTISADEFAQPSREENFAQLSQRTSSSNYIDRKVHQTILADKLAQSSWLTSLPNNFGR